MKARVLAAGVAAIMLCAAQVAAETASMPTVDLPDPYAAGVNFGQLPEGRQWGGVIAVAPDRDGKSIWAFERCGGNCLNSDLPAVLEFDSNGKLTRALAPECSSFRTASPSTRTATSTSPMPTARTARAMSLSSSARGQGAGYGQARYPVTRPFLLALRRRRRPTIASPTGMGASNARTSSSPLTARSSELGQERVGAWEFQRTARIGLDPAGRVFVADRVTAVSRSSTDGKFLAEWKQFGRPSAVSSTRTT